MIEAIRRMLLPFPRLFRAARGVYRAAQRCYQPFRLRRERALVRRFHRLYYHGSYGEYGRWQGFDWFGVTVQKCPMDLCVYQEILCRTRPDVIVETGVYYGGSTFFLAHLCDLLGHGTILACDITLERLDPRVRAHPRVELLEGSSIDPAIVERIQKRCRRLKTMVILDSDHRKEHVLEELKHYAPLVTRGCYLICEDTNINGHPVDPSFGPGPYEAVRQFLSTDQGFVVDRECERFLLTFNPGGYLRRSG